MNNLTIKGTQEFMGVNIPIVEGGFGEGKKVILAKDIARIHFIEVADINKLINRNITRFNENDLINLLNHSEEFRSFAKENGLIGSNRTKDVFLLSERGYAKVANLMKGQSEISNKLLERYFNSDIVSEPTNTKEYYFYQQLKEQLSVFNINDCKTQYNVLNYKIDLYIPSLNIAIEYDENGHDHYSYKQQELRQVLIEKKLKCKFIRVTDKYSINIACAKVIKEIVKGMVA